MDYSNPFLMALRRGCQRLGLLRPLSRVYQKFSGAKYEEKFGSYIVSRIAVGDVVWDVGANVGLYTAQFARRAGPAGRIVAFEPAPASFIRLRQQFLSSENVVLENVALADFDGEADFTMSSDNPTDPTNGLAWASGGASSIGVRVCRGDAYLAEFPERLPNRIKIDVEGFELEVIRGLHNTLTMPQVKSIFVEVHFNVLRERGLSNAPAEIKALLERAGFGLRWVDPSHLVAERAPN